MRQYFADTAYWLATLNRNDAFHDRAMQFSDSISHDEIVTSELVLIEVLDGATTVNEPYRVIVGDFVDDLIRDGEVKIIPASTAQFKSAHIFYRRHRDKLWSLTDCSSFLIMKAHRIQDALTADYDFVQAGFRALLR